jgi:hypothetical protein
VPGGAAGRRLLGRWWWVDFFSFVSCW